MHNFHIKSGVYWQGREGDATLSPPTPLGEGWKSVEWNKSDFGTGWRLRGTFLRSRQGSGSLGCWWLWSLPGDISETWAGPASASVPLAGDRGLGSA